MSLVPWPVAIDKITPFAVELAWNQICDKGYKETVFYDGEVKDVGGFARLLLSGPSFFLWDTDTDKWVFASWAWPQSNGWAQVHFTALGGYRREMALKAQEVWKGMGFYGVYGIIPEKNEKAQRLVRLLGWKRGGTIPGFCDMKYKDTRESGVFWHKVLGG